MSIGPAPTHARPARVPGRTPIRLGARLSGVWRPRSMLVAVAGLLVTVFAMAANIGRGEYPMGVFEVLRVLFGGGGEAGQFIVLQLRLPRSLTGALVGAALAVSGAISQSILRNPLASPDILGVTAGAGAAALLLVAGTSATGAASGLVASLGLPVAALLGGLLAASAIYVLAWRDGIEGYRFVLVGIGINAALVSVTSWLLTVIDITEAARAMVWLTGSLNARGWEHVQSVGLALLVLVPVALVLTFVLGALQFGDDTVRGLGVRVNVARTALLLIAVMLASVATAAAGPLAFVALVTPQIAVRLAGASRPPLLAAATVGAALTVTADLVARTAFGAVDLPVGVVTAAGGAPFLLYLLARQNRRVRV